MSAQGQTDEGWDDAAPRPEALIHSLRSFGYTPETAIADLVDNSVGAGHAKHVAITFEWAGIDSHVAVRDNGDGMEEDELLAAMRPGSTSPLEQRGKADLGRFGLGLKTASFSQAKEVTVVSKGASGQVSVRRWDLDLVGQTGQWRLLRTPSDAAVPYVSIVARHGGTAVIWSKCDRLIGELGEQVERSHERFLKTADRVIHHLGMTFHRYLEQRKYGLKITVNGKTVNPWNPILAHSATSQISEPEHLPLAGTTVTVVPYVLPHRSKLTPEEQEQGAGIHGWTAQQGFYAYRNDRLVVTGDWLGIDLTKDEHTKLARIVVEFDSSIDLLWQIDVKKSTARPPGPIVRDLKRIARATRKHAEEVYRYRGTSVHLPQNVELIFAWQEHKDRWGRLSLRVNRKHPVVQDALQGSKDQKRVVEKVLRFVEETIPTTLIGVRLADTLDHQHVPYNDSSEELTSLLEYSFQSMITSGCEPDDVLEKLSVVEPFANHPGVLEAFKENHR